MYHKVSDMCDKIDVIHEKATYLRLLKYEGAKDDFSTAIIDNTIADIQSLCREVAADTHSYIRVQE